MLSPVSSTVGSAEAVFFSASLGFFSSSAFFFGCLSSLSRRVRCYEGENVLVVLTRRSQHGLGQRARPSGGPSEGAQVRAGFRAGGAPFAAVVAGSGFAGTAGTGALGTFLTLMGPFALAFPGSLVSDGRSVAGGGFTPGAFAPK